MAGITTPDRTDGFSSRRTLQAVSLQPLHNLQYLRYDARQEELPWPRCLHRTHPYPSGRSH